MPASIEPYFDRDGAQPAKSPRRLDHALDVGKLHNPLPRDQRPGPTVPAAREIAHDPFLGRREHQRRPQQEAATGDESGPHRERDRRAEQAQEPGHARAHAADMRTDAVAQNDDPQEEARSHECGPGAPPAAGEKHAPGIVHARTVRQPSAGSEVS